MIMYNRYVKAAECAEKISINYDIPLFDLVDVFADIPTADVVEVVRCKECKHFYEVVYNGKVLQRECRLRSNGSGIGIVFLESETDFCSYGERSTDNAKENL